MSAILMETRLYKKRLGDVEIFEADGAFQGSQAEKSFHAIQQVLKHEKTRNVLFNMQELSAIDEFSARTLLKVTNAAAKCVVTFRNPSVKAIIQKMDSLQRLYLYERMDDAARMLARELAASGKAGFAGPDRRRYRRLPVILPLRFHLNSVRGTSVSGFAVVTNLSEGGLFAEFIESSSESALFDAAPQEAALIRLGMSFSSRESVTLHGQLIHAHSATNGMGVEFCDMGDDARGRIRGFLDEVFLKEEEY